MPTDTSFSSGFAAGGGVINAREDRRVLEEQNRQAQQNLMRERADASAVDALEKLGESSKKLSAAFFTSKGLNDQKGMDEAIAIQTETAKTLWGSTKQMLESVGYTEAEIANIREQFRIGAMLNNPAAEQKLIAAGEAGAKVQPAIDKAAGISDATQANELEQIRERGRQAQITAGTPRHETITNEDPNALAPPQIGQIFGMENATEQDLRDANIFLPEDKKTLRELIPASASYKGLISSGTSALEILKREPDVAAIGGLSEFADNVRSQATALARQFGMDVGEINLESDEVKDAVSRIAGENRQLQSVMISMAYASAIAKGQTGQGLSDKDVANEVKQIGGDAKTPEGMQRALMAFMERNESDYRGRIRNTLNQAPGKSAYSMNSDELVQFIEQVGGFDKLSEQDQMVVRMRKRFLEQQK